METATLARTLGTTTHLSPLLRKAERLGLDARGLERLAIQRGCDYCHALEEPVPPAAMLGGQFSNEELALALLNPALRYDPQTLRLGAAMSGAHGNDPAHTAYMASHPRGAGGPRPQRVDSATRVGTDPLPPRREPLRPGTGRAPVQGPRERFWNRERSP